MGKRCESTTKQKGKVVLNGSNFLKLD